MIDEPLVGQLTSEPSLNSRAPVVRLRHRLVHPGIARLISKKDCERYKIFPVSALGPLELAMVNPDDKEAIKHVSAITGYSVCPVAATEEDIQAAINYYLTD